MLHAQDNPPLLRKLVVELGYRIDAEGLAPEAKRFAEVLRVVPGEETATGLTLELGPRLLERGDPLLHAHFTQLLGFHEHIAQQTRDAAPDVHAAAQQTVDFLRAWLDAHPA